MELRKLRRQRPAPNLRRARLESFEDRRLLAVGTADNTLDNVNGDTSSIAAQRANGGRDDKFVEKFAGRNRLLVVLLIGFLSVFCTPVRATFTSLIGDYFIGNSLTNDTRPQYIPDAGYTLYSGKNLMDIHSDPDGYAEATASWTEALTTSAFDYVVVQPHFGTTLQQDVDVISSWMSMQPSTTKWIIHTGWERYDRLLSTFDGSWDGATMIHNPDYFWALLDSLQALHPGVRMTINPAVQVLRAIANDIADGTAPYSALSDLYRDALHMSGTDGWYLQHNLMRSTLGLPFVSASELELSFDTMTPQELAAFNQRLRYLDTKILQAEWSMPREWLTGGQGGGTATVKESVGLFGSIGVEVHRGENSDDRWTIPVGGLGIPNFRYILVDWDMSVPLTGAANVFGPFFGVDTCDHSNSPNVLGSLGVDATTGDVLYQSGGSGVLEKTGTVVGSAEWHHYQIRLDFLLDNYHVLVDGVPLAMTDFVGGPRDRLTDADIAAIAGGTDAGSLSQQGMAYFANFEVREVVPGDFDFDGDVDGSDLAIWQAAYGVDAQGDADDDGDSDGADFLLWQRYFGSGTHLSVVAAAVPEPSVFLPAILGFSVFGFRRIALALADRITRLQVARVCSRHNTVWST